MKKRRPRPTRTHLGNEGTITNDPHGYLKKYRPPPRFTEDCLQEAYVAFLEGRDPIEAMHALVNHEKWRERRHRSTTNETLDTFQRRQPPRFGSRSRKYKDDSHQKHKGCPRDSAGKPYRGQRAEVPGKDPCEGCGQKRRYCLCTRIH